MSPDKDLRERLLTASNRETRHNFDVGDYWNLCEESANALEWHEARRTYHSTLTLMEHERVRAERDAALARVAAAEKVCHLVADVIAGANSTHDQITILRQMGEAIEAWRGCQVLAEDEKG